MIKSDGKGGIIIDERDHFNPFSEICSRCAHKYMAAAHACEAFDNIPDEIWSGKNQHQAPFSGDRGIQFAERKQGEWPAGRLPEHLSVVSALKNNAY